MLSIDHIPDSDIKKINQTFTSSWHTHGSNYVKIKNKFINCNV